MMRYEVYIEGHAVHLNPNEGFDLLLRNPMLFYDRIPGSNAAGIKLPKSDLNKSILGDIADPLNTSAVKSFFCQQVLNGNLIEEGYAVITDAENEYSLEFSTNLGDFFTGIQNELISQIDLGTLSVPVDWDSIISNTWDLGGYVAPMLKNSAFYGSESPMGWDGIVNKFSGGAYVAEDMVPMFFLKRILDDLASLANVTISGEFWESDLLESLLLYNSKVADGVAIEIKEHLPEMTVGELFMNLRRFLNVVYWFDGIGKNLKIESADTVWNKPCVLDWSGKTGKPKGASLGITGARFGSNGSSGDGLSKDVFFDPYIEGEQSSILGVESVFSSMPMVGGYPAIEAGGITDEQPDNSFPAKILASTGDATASNGFDTTVFRWNDADGLAAKRFARDIEFWRNTFRIKASVALNAGDISQISRIFKGLEDTGPFVHIHGVNYVIEEVNVPSDSAISEVSLLRL